MKQIIGVGATVVEEAVRIQTQAVSNCVGTGRLIKAVEK